MLSDYTCHSVLAFFLYIAAKFQKTELYKLSFQEKAQKNYTKNLSSHRTKPEHSNLTTWYL